MNKRQSLGPGMRLTKKDQEQLGLEVISTEARVRLTRLLRDAIKSKYGGEDSAQIELIRKNNIVNIANTALGRPIYVLETAEWDYEPAEYGWHQGEFELVTRRPDSPKLIEILADLIEEGILSYSDVNTILLEDGCAVQFSHDDGVSVELLSSKDLPEEQDIAGEHKNVRILFERMDRALQEKDWSLVVHTGASIFETIAKQVVSNPAVQNQSLGGWIQAYRKASSLAAPLLDAIAEIFTRRNIEPLAGHGSVADPSVTEAEAIAVRELTIAIVRMERLLASAQSAQIAAAPKKKTKPNKS